MSDQYFEIHRIVDENGVRDVKVFVNYDPEQKVIEYFSAQARSKRNSLFNIVDSMNPMRWETLSENEKQAWRDYRQALLDVPQQEGFPEILS